MKKLLVTFNQFLDLPEEAEVVYVEMEGQGPVLDHILYQGKKIRPEIAYVEYIGPDTGRQLGWEGDGWEQLPEDLAHEMYERTTLEDYRILEIYDWHEPKQSVH